MDEKGFGKTRIHLMKKSRSKSQEYSFQSELWKNQGKGGWHFITLPKQLSKKIRRNHGFSEEGWGRLKTIAKTGSSTWNTSVWFDKKIESYLLPLKASIRKKESLKVRSLILVTLQFQEND